jgi:hypothetical protein
MASMNRLPYAVREVSREEYEADQARRKESAARSKAWVAKRFPDVSDADADEEIDLRKEELRDHEAEWED